MSTMLRLFRSHFLFSGDRPFECELCGKGFALRETLVKHRDTHNEMRPFKCTVGNNSHHIGLQNVTRSCYCCQGVIWFEIGTVAIQGYFIYENFYAVSNFVGTLSFQICLSEFKRKDGLMTHLETHRADSRFVCGVEGCGSGFNQLIHLRKHISSTHSSTLSLNIFCFSAWNKSLLQQNVTLTSGVCGIKYIL